MSQRHSRFWRRCHSKIVVRQSSAKLPNQRAFNSLRQLGRHCSDEHQIVWSMHGRVEGISSAAGIP